MVARIDRRGDREIEQLGGVYSRVEDQVYLVIDVLALSSITVIFYA